MENPAGGRGVPETDLDGRSIEPEYATPQLDFKYPGLLASVREEVESDELFMI